MAKWHNCWLCKKEWLSRCFGETHYGEAVDDDMICEEYVFGGSEERLREIQEMEASMLNEKDGIK